MHKNRKIFIFSILFLIFNLNSVQAQNKNEVFGFEGGTSPMDWGEIVEFLRLDLHLCRQGTNQSPINIKLKHKIPGIDEKKLVTHYFSTPIRIINNGHTIHLNYNSGSKVYWRKIPFELIQFHFHAPSEHTINQNQFDMEMHLVHKNKNNEFLVIGVFLKEGKHNKNIQKIWDRISNIKNEEKIYHDVIFNVKSLLPPKIKYLHYLGSLTTPPCLENVNWFIIENPVDISKDQIKYFKNFITHNARPTQKLNKRIISIIK
jgi:carbonic anhydrase